MAQVLPAKRSHGFSDHHTASLSAAAGPSRGKRRRISVELSERSTSTGLESRHTTDDGHFGASESEDDERGLDRATQMVFQSFQKHAGLGNTPAEAGIIEEVRCTNFMCHEQLTVTLGPLINFIIGENGSGKSAVLTALTLCLGGKATATNRGQSLKAFVKQGRDSCILSVKLKNQGCMAYKPDQYGDSIIVERHFNTSGASGFKLKDRNGRIVSTKKAELEDIIDAFALQLDNPMNVLTQDQARSFLHSSNPSQKYKFFLKGTQLENLNNDYKQMENELEEQEVKAQTLLADLKVYRDKFEEAKKKAESATRLKEMRTSETKLAFQATWAHVEHEERELEKLREGVERCSVAVAEKQVEADAESDKFDHADAAVRSTEEAKQELKARLEPAQDDFKECKVKFEEARALVAKLKAEERKIAGQVRSSERAVLDTQTQMQEYKERQIDADNGVHAQKMAEWEEAKAKYNEQKAAWERHHEALSTIVQDRDDARKKKSAAHRRMVESQEEEAASRRKIRDLEQGQRRWIDSYPRPQMLERLLSAIDSERRFRETPVGPMGRYVELLKPEWASILEKSFGASLNAFVVTSKDDQSILSDIMKKHNYQTPILIGRKDPIDTSSNEPNKDLLTWMRALKISNELVRNQLIINQSIDQVVLIPKRHDAQNFMNSDGPHRKNVKMCFCMSDSNRRRGHSITVNPSTRSSNLGPIEQYDGPPRMQADKGSQIQDEKENLAAIQQRTRSLEAEVAAAQRRLDSCEAKFQNHGKEKMQLKIRMDSAQDDMVNLEDDVTKCAPDISQIEQLENELRNANERLALDEQQFETFTTKKDMADQDSKQCFRQLQAAKAVRDELEMEYSKLSAKLTTLANRREQALRSKNQALEAVQKAEAAKSSWDQSLSAQLFRLRETTEQAINVCPRVEVPPGQTFESLQRKCEKLRDARRLAESELGGSEEELLRRANQAKRELMDAQNRVEGTVAVRTALKRALQTRQERWRKLRQAISMRARVIFNYLLSERRFRGSLSVDHHAQRLDIHIQPDITVKEDEGRQTKTLSGGEKSFSTICLLLSLWDAMGSPIRCLDEFDVFMDQANRDIAMKMIIDLARKSVGRQYILITPQGISNAGVGNAADVKIIKLASPERGQTALRLAQ